MPDEFLYRKSASRLTSLDASVDRTQIDEDVVRDITTDKTVLGDLFTDPEYNDLTSITRKYYEEFITGTTFDHRKTLRKAACCFWEYAKNDLYNKMKDEANAILQQERLVLEENLYRTRASLVSAVGCTRGSFAMGITQKTLADNSIHMAGAAAELDLKFREVELSALQVGFSQLYQAYIVADESDFGKYATLLSVLRGAKTKEKLDQKVDDDSSKHGVSFSLSAKWNRTVGQISEANGDYTSDYDAIMSAGAGAIGA